MEHSHFVGIDVSKNHLDVHVRPTGDSFRVTYDDAGLVLSHGNAAGPYSGERIERPVTVPCAQFILMRAGVSHPP
jgi:hypothetical protein